MSSSKITKHDLDDSVFEGLASQSYVQTYTEPYSESNMQSYVNTYSQAKHKTLTITLSQSSWSSGSQTVTATGVTTSNTVIVSPAPASLDDYGKSKVKCTAQASNKLTFTCSTDKVPTSNLTINVVILGV